MQKNTIFSMVNDSRSINIVFVESGGGHGGSMSYLYSVLKHIDRTMFFPSVVMYYRSDAVLVRRIEELDIKIHFLSRRKRPKECEFLWTKNVLVNKVSAYCIFVLKLFIDYFPAAFRMVSIIKRTKSRIVLVGSEVDFNIPAVLASKITRTLLVVRKSGAGTNDVNLIRRFLCQYVDIFIASSEAEKLRHKEHGLASKKIERIYEGVDLSVSRGINDGMNVRKELGIPIGCVVIISVSRFEDGKGHDDLLAAARLVCDKLPETIFMIVGDDFDSKDGKMRKTLYSMTEKLSLQKNVIFTGWRDDVVSLLHASDIFVHCPNRWREGMGIAALEALACGKPTVITNNCGLAETTLDGYNGFVVAIGDYLALAEKIIRLAVNVSLRLEYGKNSRIYAENFFDISKNVKKTEELLRTYLKE